MDFPFHVNDFHPLLSKSSDKDALKAGKSDEVQEALQERDSALEELNSVERSFSDLHRRYEKTKSLIEGFKKNEESLKRVAEEWQQGLRKEQERYKALKAHAEEKLEMANKVRTFWCLSLG